MQTKMIPLSKQSKKQRKEYHSLKRGTWNGLSPVTRIVRSKKLMIETELNSNISDLPTFDDCLLHNRVKARHRRRRINRIRKRVDLMRIIDYKRYSPHIGYVDYSFNGIEFVRTGRYIKYPKNSKCQKWMKKATAHKYRTNKDIPRKGNYYRRLFDYWWTMY